MLAQTKRADAHTVTATQRAGVERCADVHNILARTGLCVCVCVKVCVEVYRLELYSAHSPSRQRTGLTLHKSQPHCKNRSKEPRLRPIASIHTHIYYTYVCGYASLALSPEDTCRTTCRPIFFSVLKQFIRVDAYTSTDFEMRFAKLHTV